MINVVISGVTGKMGKSLVKLISSKEEWNIIGGLASEKNRLIGKDIGIISGIGNLEISLTSSLVGIENPNVLIDFSEPSFSINILRFCKKENIPMVVGTTGFKKSELRFISKSAEVIPILYAPNTSPGIAIVKRIIESLENSLDLFKEITISEKHHKNKKDSPSGTAIDLAQLFMERIERKEKISIESERKGELVGEHNITFSMEEEIIEINHKALNRSVFAVGSLLGAEWLISKPKGLYKMSDIYLS